MINLDSNLNSRWHFSAFRLRLINKEIFEALFGVFTPQMA